MSDKNKRFKTEVTRVNGYLKEIVTFFDESGKPISQTINPLMVELKPRDALQLFVGSFLIAAPLCFTEEVWKLSETLDPIRVNSFITLSLLIVTLYIYFNFYKNRLIGNVIQFTKRLLATYLISISSVVLLLLLLNKLPLDSWVSFNRVVIIGFPAIFGAVLSDSLK